MSILQPFSALEKAIKNRGSRKDIFKIEFIDDKKIEWAKDRLNKFTSSQYKNWKAISDGTQEAKSSFDAYVASCISGRKKLSAEGYKDFLNQNIGQYSNGKGGAQQVLDKYKELTDAVAEAEAKVSRSQLAISAFTNPDIDDDEHMQVKNSLKENEDALHKAKMAYEDFDNAVSAGNPDLAEFAKQGNLGAGAGKKFAKVSKSVAVAEKARAAGHALANAALSFGLSVLLQLVSTGLMALINADKEAIEKANELGEEYKKTNEEISNHTEKIKELKDAIASGTLTEAESYDKKKELLEIQNELYDSYGKQAEGIDLVNGKYDEEIAKLREINKQKAIEALNNGGYAGEKAANNIINATNTSGWNVLASGGILSKFSLGASQVFSFDTEVKRAIIDKAQELGGKKQLNGIITFDNKTIDEMLAIYDELIAYVNENFDAQDKHVQNWLSTLSKRRGKLNSDEYTNAKQALENAALSRIMADDDAYNYYVQIQQAIVDYNEAVMSGDTEAINEETQKLLELKDGITAIEEAANHKNVEDYFNGLFDAFNRDISMTKLEQAITRGVENPNSTWKKLADSIRGKTDVGATAFINGLDTNDAEENKLKQLVDTAKEMFGINLEDIIDAFIELGIVESTTSDTTDITVKTFSTLVEQLEEAKTSVEKFDNAISKISLGESLSESEINELLAIDPSLLSSVERVADGYVIAYDKISDAREKLLEAQRNSVAEEISDNRKEELRIRKGIAQLTNKINYEAESNWNYWNEKLKTAKNDREKEIIQQNMDHYAKQLDGNKEINKEIDDRKNKLEEINAETSQYQFLLKQLEDPFDNWAEQLNNVANAVSSITDKIITMKTQIFKSGKIDPTTALDFIQAVPNYSDYITIGDNGITLNDLNDDSMLELIKQTTGYNTVTQEMTNTIQKNVAERKTQQDIVDNFYSNLKKNGQTTEDEAKAMGRAQNRVSQLDAEISSANETLSDTEILLKSIIELFKEDEATQAFNDAVDTLDHQLAMDLIDDKAYSKAFDDYVKDLEKAVANGNSEAQATWDSAKEKQLSLWKSLEQSDYDEDKAQLDNQLEDRTISYLEYQKQLKAINEKYYGEASNLGNSEDGKKQYKENLREIEKLSSEAYDNITSRFQSAIDFGKIIDPNIINDLADVFKGQELPDAVAQVIKKGIETGIWNATDLATIAPYLTEALLSGSDVNSEAYQNAIAQQKDYVISAFEDEKTQLENQLEAGLISSSQFIDGLTGLWEKYYKDKQEFAEEDLQTQKDILEAHKSEIQKQIDALEAYSESQTDPYQDEIDALNEVKDAYDDMMDERIDALEEEKDLLEKQNDEQEKANDLREKYLNLQKASMAKRVVYTGSGNWELRRDEEEYNNAKKEYEDAKKEEATSKIDEAIEKLQEEKESRDNAINEDIDAREDAIKRIQKPIDDLTKVLTLLVTEQQNIDPEFIAQLLNTESADEAIALINKKNSFGQEQEAKYGVDANYDQLTTETINKLAKEAEKRNQTLDEYAKSLGLSLGEKTNDSVSANTDAINKNTEALKNSNTAITSAETNKNLDADGYLIGADGNKILNNGNAVKATTHDEWAKKHKVSEWSPAGKEVNENMTMEQYEKLKKAQEKGIIPASVADIASISDEDLAKFLSIIQSNKNIFANNTNTPKMTTALNDVDLPNKNITNAPTINFTVNVEGSADQKTVRAMEEKITAKLVEYTDAVTNTFKKKYSSI